jgi:hypothetical protein
MMAFNARHRKRAMRSPHQCALPACTQSHQFILCRSPVLTLEKYSIGVGDRFAHQAAAQLEACRRIADDGFRVIPVWNKSNREHDLIGSEPSSVRAAAEAAVNARGWGDAWHVDADHIRLHTVDRFIPSSDFFTIDVADSIGAAPEKGAIENFIGRHPELLGNLEVPHLAHPVRIDRAALHRTAAKFLRAVTEAAHIYRHIANQKGAENFIAEVSMDETDAPQTPDQLLIILAALADEKVRVQTIAPKFTGRFNKGVDYRGDLAQFETEFHDDLAVIAFAVERFDLPRNLKLSVHSGSDKFSLYPIIRRALPKLDAGVHLKTAGTTWLEELIGLAEAGGEGLRMAQEIYREARDHQDALCQPYASVVDIDPSHLPPAEDVASWNSSQFVAALRHDPDDPAFNPHLRQLLHVAFKLAARKGKRFLELLEAHSEIIGKNVTENIYARHLRPLFVG